MAGGNNSKLGRNKPGGANSGGNMKDAVDLETAAWAMNQIKYRAKRERHAANLARRAKVTLPELGILKKPIED